MNGTHLTRPVAILLLSIIAVGLSLVLAVHADAYGTRCVWIGSALIFSAGLFTSALLFHKRTRLSQVVGLTDPTATVVLTRPKSFVWCQVAVFSIAASGVYWLGRSELPIPYMSYFVDATIVLSVLTIILALRGLRDNVTITLSPHGFDYSTSGIGAIEWKDIQKVELSGGRIWLGVIAKEKYLIRWPTTSILMKLFRNPFDSPFAVPAEIADVPREALVEATSVRLAHFNVKLSTMDKK